MHATRCPRSSLSTRCRGEGRRGAIDEALPAGLPPLTAILLALGFLAGCASPTAGPPRQRRPARARAARVVVTVSAAATRPLSFVLTSPTRTTPCAPALGQLGVISGFGTGPGVHHAGLRGRQARLLPGADRPVATRTPPRPPRCPLLHQDHQDLPGRPPAPLQLPGQANLLPADQHVRPPGSPHLGTRPSFAPRPGPRPGPRPAPLPARLRLRPIRALSRNALQPRLRIIIITSNDTRTTPGSSP